MGSISGDDERCQVVLGGAFPSYRDLRTLCYRTFDFVVFACSAWYFSSHELVSNVNERLSQLGRVGLEIDLRFLPWDRRGLFHVLFTNTLNTASWSGHNLPSISTVQIRA